MVYSDDEEEFDADFEAKYDKFFSTGKAVKTEEFEHDVITGRRSKRPKMSVLNKSKVSKQELDDLFLSN